MKTIKPISNPGTGPEPDGKTIGQPDFRLTHVGHWMTLALQKFDARVLYLMANHPDMPLALANLAARGQLNASHIQITRHLAVEGSRLTELADRAQITKQAMGKLVEQCEAWDLVTKLADAHDARAKRVVFTPAGQAWLHAFEQALAQAQAELALAVGTEVATVIALGLEAYVA